MVVALGAAATPAAAARIVLAFLRRAAVTAIERLPRGGRALVLGDNASAPVGHTYLRSVEQVFGRLPKRTTRRT
jgi:hypothetical protein